MGRPPGRGVGPGPSLLAAHLAALLLLAGPLPAAPSEPGADGLRGLDKITWSSGKGLTRLRFHVGWSLEPEVAQSSPLRLRIDLRGLSASASPQRLKVGTPEVEGVERLPEAARGFLPPGVSERYFVVLRSEAVGWNLEATDDGFELLVGDPELTGRRSSPGPPPSMLEALAPPSGPTLIQPEAGEMLRAALPFRSRAGLSVRAGPSAVHAELRRIEEGAVEVADAVRGDWVHLRDGGWLRHALAPAADSGTDLKRRSAAAWSVVTIVPVLNIRVEEVLPGRDPAADLVGSYFAEPVRLARLTILATGKTPFSFRFPPRPDRLRLLLEDGSETRNLDPFALSLSEGVGVGELEEAFPAPSISTGEGFSGWLVLPGGLDFLEVEEARIDIAGRLHLLFRVPGSGELMGE